MGAERGINYLKTSTALKDAKLLDRARHRDGTFVFGQANGAIDQYAAVKIDNDGQVEMLTTTVSGAEPTAVGIAQVAFADNEYGWFWVGEGGGSGKGIKVKVAASCVAGAKLYTTATAGVLDDTATDCIQGLSTLTTDGGAGSSVEVYAPNVLMTNGQD